MRKIMLMLCLIGSSAVFAYTSKGVHTESKSVYCPPIVTCTSDECTFNSLEKNYFGDYFISNNDNDGSPLSSSYSLASTTAMFHSNSFYEHCGYLSKEKKPLRLLIKSEANLEAHHTPDSSWTSSSNCEGNCPLKENLGFVIRNSILPEDILLSINGVDIHHLTKEYTRVIYEDALVGCAKQKECSFDISSSNHTKYGSVVVNMDTMKISNVASLDKAIEIKKTESFNAVEIHKIGTDNDREAIYCPAIVKRDQNGSCTFASAYGKYFGEPQCRATSYAIFEFKSVKFNSYDSSAICNYSNRATQATATVSIKAEANLEPYFERSSQMWQIQSPTYECSNANVSLCPFKQRVGFMVHNSNVTNGIYVSVKEKDISRLILTQNPYVGISRADVSDCGGQKTCVIEIMSSKHAKYGSITIDVDTMKVLEVVSLYPSYIKMDKLTSDSFDTVNIAYINLK